MFNINLRRLYFVCDKFIVRNVRNRRHTVEQANPGLQHRITAFREEGMRIEEDDAEEFMEQSASDFSNMGDIYETHLDETVMGKHELRHKIVRDKYFKENMPNLLTWSEKEQIRHLASTNPEEWTPDKIAQSFPVTEQVVKKLIKYPWKPATEERISRHDTSALRNWRELKEGNLKISEELRKHFLKFSDRIIPPLNKKSIKIDLTRNRDMGEFESIVRKCADKDEKSESYDESNSPHTEDNSTDISIKEKVKKDWKRVTLEELSAKIDKRLKEGNTVALSDKLIVTTLNDTDVNLSNISEEELKHEIVIPDKEDSTVTEYREKDKNVLSLQTYPQRIRIPKKAYKKGATYKVNDCYYDHDGRFLYRVIGMKN